MNEIDKYKEKLEKPPRQATLMFLIKDDKILLAMKKRGFAEGKWNGMGGKSSKEDKTILDTAIRETKEEIDVIPIDPKKVATLNFYFLDGKDWNQQVTVYLTKKWSGRPKETEEMKPRWFKIKDIPYDKMWEDDIYWLPQVLNGNTIEGEFLFNSDQKMLEKNVRKIN